MRRQKRRPPAPPAKPKPPSEPAGTFRPFTELKDRLPPPAKPAPPPPPPRPAPPPPASDESAFRVAMGGVAPIERPAPAPRPSVPPPPAEDELVLADQFLSALVEGELPFDFTDTSEYVQGSVRGLDANVVRKLRAGDFAVEAHLDLHGLDRAEAKAAVRDFVERSQRDGRRCLLVVHGRGLNSKDHVPVLKERLRDWLSRGGLGRRVLAFTSARPCDGGTGAVYVLLRRRREG